MKVKYDKANDLFVVNGKQLYWSSVYVLRQKSTDFKSLCRKLKVSKSEQPMFREELDDLLALKFIRGKNKITTTKLGKEFLHEAEHKVKFKNLREISIDDIDDVFTEADKVYKINLNKTKSLIKKTPFHHEHVEWFSLFVNSAIGYVAFLLAMLVTLMALGSIVLDEFIIQLIMLPITAVLTIGILVIVLWLLYHAGQGISSYLFRRK